MPDATNRCHSPSLHCWSVHYGGVHLHVAKHLEGIFCCACSLLYLGSILTVSFDPRPALKAVESSITITAAWWNSMHHQKMKPDQKITSSQCTLYNLDFAWISFIVAPGQRKPLMCPEIHNPTSPLPSYIVNEMWQRVIRLRCSNWVTLTSCDRSKRHQTLIQLMNYLHSNKLWFH